MNADFIHFSSFLKMFSRSFSEQSMEQSFFFARDGLLPEFVSGRTPRELRCTRKRRFRTLFVCFCLPIFCSEIINRCLCNTDDRWMHVCVCMYVSLGFTHSLSRSRSPCLVFSLPPQSSVSPLIRISAVLLDRAWEALPGAFVRLRCASRDIQPHIVDSPLG